MWAIRMCPYVVLWGALLGAQAATRTHQTNPMSSPEDYQEGKRLYWTNCVVCHGLDGKSGRGSRLARRSFRHGNSDAELFDLIEAGIPGTDMPGVWLDEEQIWKILLFIRTFSETASTECEAGGGDANEGKRIFNTVASCGSCHTVGSQGGRLGPDMSVAGSLFTREQLRVALLDPVRDIAARYRTVRLVTAEGEAVEGVWINENAYRIYLMDRSENIRSFQKAHLRSLEHPEESLMPSYRELLSADDLEDLLEYLCTLRNPDEKEN